MTEANFAAFDKGLALYRAYLIACDRDKKFTALIAHHEAIIAALTNNRSLNATAVSNAETAWNTFVFDHDTIRTVIENTAAIAISAVAINADLDIPVVEASRSRSAQPDGKSKARPSAATASRPRAETPRAKTRTGRPRSAPSEAPLPDGLTMPPIPASCDYPDSRFRSIWSRAAVEGYNDAVAGLTPRHYRRCRFQEYGYRAGYAHAGAVGAQRPIETITPRPPRPRSHRQSAVSVRNVTTVQIGDQTQHFDCAQEA